MTDQIVNEWITEWNQIRDLEKERITTYATSILANEDLFQAITHILDESDRFKPLYSDVIATLFKFYRTSSQKKLQLFCSQFIPSLIYVYLHQIHTQKKCISLETLLRGIFELENASEERVPISARIPNINLPSIYHDPGGVSTTWLSDGELDRLTARTVKVCNRPNLVFTEERVRAPQRLPLCTELWWIFNHRLPDMPSHAVPTFLKTISKLVTQGFNVGLVIRTQPPVRIILSSKLLIEMVQTIYFSVYNGAPTLAEQVLEEALTRANYQLWADAMLVCNAVQSYLKSSVNRWFRQMQAKENPGATYPSKALLLRTKSYLDEFIATRVNGLISSPHFPRLSASTLDTITTKGTGSNGNYLDASSEFIRTDYSLNDDEIPIQVEPGTFKKSIITNASFRTKKLPDDIPIVAADTTIHEDGGDAPMNLLSKSKSKLPHMILSKISKRNSVVVINEEGDAETLATPPERKKSIDATAV